MLEESEVPVWEIGMPEGFPHKKIASVDPVAGIRLVRVFHDLTNFVLGFRGQALVRIENKNPLVLEGKVFQGPVLFLGLSPAAAATATRRASRLSPPVSSSADLRSEI